MTQISFSVSARMARLIGQENFTNAEGAIVELVKNSYDADSKTCIVIYDLPFINFTDTLSEAGLAIIKDKDIKLYSALEFEPGSLRLTTNTLKTYRYQVLKNLWSAHSIYIIDNGHGMNDETIRKHWMIIGTGNKEVEYKTGDGRIKTGAKGIGRFALDRLGAFSEMWTRPENLSEGFYWKMDWNQFEVPGLAVEQINADLEPCRIEHNSFISERFSSLSFFNELTTTDFSRGTIIRISQLRDDWSNDQLELSYKNLLALIPPEELKIPFKVFQGLLQSPNEFGKVETASYEDYDYKITAHYNAPTQTVDYTITRNELDLHLVETKFGFLYGDAQHPYDLATIKNKEFTINDKDIYEMLKWERDDYNSVELENVGDFTFHFYFLKSSTSNKENYPYKVFNAAERQSLFSRFGGVKIYRDSFRVRPYGDPQNDWLNFGERAQRSPAGPGQRIGQWRVAPYQVAGIINISRIKNPKLIDKSDRGALVENSTFDLLKKIVTAIVHEFEYDRSRILNPYYLYFEAEKKKKLQAEIHVTAQKIADEMYATRIEKEKVKEEPGVLSHDHTDLSLEKEHFQRALEIKLSKFQRNEEKDAEISQVRSIASLGLIVASFAHELKGIRNNVAEIIVLEGIYKQFKGNTIVSERDFRHGERIINLLKNDGEKIKHWVDYSLTAIKKDRRKRARFNFANYFEFIKNAWEVPLKNREITLNITSESITDYEFRAFEIDMDTIFTNLITNSIDALNNRETVVDRTISIHYYIADGNMCVIYKDNGTGIPNVFRDKDDIFLPFTTSKKDRNGNDIGTGLGMYLVKMVIEDNNANIKILQPEEGFSVQIDFPLRNN